MSTVVTVDGRRRAVLAGSSSAGATVDWWLAHHAGELGPEALFRAVRAEGDAPTGVIVLPYLAGRQTPRPDPAAQLRVLGRRPEHGPATLAKAMLEGLSLQARWMLDEQNRLTGRRGAPAVTVLGGAVATNPAWVEIKARVLPNELRIVADPEPVASGAALVGAVRAGCVGPAVPALESRPAPAPPTPPDAYDDVYARFVVAARAPEVA